MARNARRKNLRLELMGHDRKTGDIVQVIDVTGRAHLVAMAEILSRQPAVLLHRSSYDYRLNRRMRSAVENRIGGVSLRPNLNWWFGITAADPIIPFLRTPKP